MYGRNQGRPWLEPALLLGQSCCLDAIAHAQFLNRSREIVADRSLSEPELSGDRGHAGSILASDQDFALTFGQGAFSFSPSRCGQSRIDDVLASTDPANGGGQSLNG